MGDTPNADKPLSVEVADDMLVISIGVKALAFAVMNGDVWASMVDAEGPISIVDEAEFARDVMHELEADDDEGTTPVHALFDKAAIAAAEGGSLGIMSEDDMDGEDARWRGQS